MKRELTPLILLSIALLLLGASGQCLAQALQGNYTIGGLFPDYDNFTEAIAALESEGMQAAVTFDVRDAVYEEQLFFNTIAGLSETNTLTFRSESGNAEAAIIEYEYENTFDNIDEFVVAIYGLSHLTFEGIGFRTLTEDGAAVHLTPGTDHLTFRACYFEGPEQSYGELIFAEDFEDETDLATNYLLVEDCYFLNGGSAIELGYSLWAAFDSRRYVANTIRSSTFVNQNKSVIQTSRQANFVVEENYIESTFGDELDVAVENWVCDEVLVNANEIYAENFGTGILTYSVAEEGTMALISNNMVSVGGIDGGQAIDIVQVDEALIAHNSFVVTSETAQAAMLLDDSGDFRIYNNVLWHAAGGPAIRAASAYLGLEPKIDHNIYYTDGPITFKAGGNEYNSIDDWTLEYEIDASSHQSNPQFNSSTDLRSVNPILDGTGRPLTEVAFDIDGDARDPVTPDIGADEFGETGNADVDLLIAELIAPELDLCAVTEPVSLTVLISNFGTDPAVGFDLSYELEGHLVSQFVDDLTVPAQGEVEFTFDESFQFSSSGDFALEVDIEYEGEENVLNNGLLATVSNGYELGPITSMSPLEGSFVQTGYEEFSWFAVNNAISYDFFYWKQGDPIPDTPFAHDLLEPSYELSAFGLEDEASYHWKVVAHSGSCMIESETLSFVFSETGNPGLPDLVISDLQMNESPFSGTPLVMGYTTSNVGTVGTSSATWYDVIFLSSDSLFDSQDLLIGGVNNLNALSGGESYSQTGFVELDFTPIGEWFVIFYADYYTEVSEGQENNNTKAFPINIQALPPADLSPQDFTVPGNAFSGTTIDLSWIVQNAGEAITNEDEWMDAIYLSQSMVWDSTASLMLELEHQGLLEVGQQYQVDTTILLPDGIVGNYYLHLITDREDEVYEAVFTANNGLVSEAMEIFLSPPPDLVINNISVPQSASNSEYVDVSYTVLNQGGSAVPLEALRVDSLWVYDELELVDSLASFSVGSALDAALEVGESMEVQQAVKMPVWGAEDQFVFIEADAGLQIFEYTFDENNLSRSAAIEILSPDLQPSDLELPEMVMSGDSIDISYALQNNGPGDLVNSLWVEAFYFSNSTVLDTSTAIAADRFEYYHGLDQQTNISRTMKIRVPDGLSGEHFVHVVVDDENGVYEAANEQNNSMAAMINIDLSPSPDLIVSNIQLDASSLLAGQNYGLSYEITNAGDTETDHPWADYLYLSEYPDWDTSEVVFLRYVQQDLSIPAGSTVTVETEVLIPMLSSLTPGLNNADVYVYVQSDFSDEIYEHGGEENNISRSDAILAACPQPPDLRLSTTEWNPLDAVSDEEVGLSWTVINAGSDPAYWEQAQWYDGLYLSEDTVYDSGDLFVKEWPSAAALSLGSSYSNTGAFDVPFSISGDYHLLLVADHREETNDSDRSNNYWIWKDQNDEAYSLSIDALPPPDLVFDQVMLPETGMTGQPVQIDFTVRNEGPGVTLSGAWQASVYLSEDFEYADHELQDYINHSGDLAVDESYTGSLQINLPQGQELEYAVILVLDPTDAEYEASGEENNVQIFPIQALLPGPSDLTVSELSFPSQAEANTAIDIAWTLRNEAINPAEGSRRDALYLSEDEVLDEDDLLLDVYEGDLQLGPLASIEQSTSLTLPAVVPGEYHVIARTDLLDAIYESNNDNNILISEETIDITVPALPLETIVGTSIEHEASLYYKIEIPEALEGETLLISLTTDLQTCNNELYLSYEEVPSRVAHDTAFDFGLACNQQLIQNDLQAGTYYLLVYGEQGQQMSQEIDLLAEIRFFEITDLQASEGGNTGMVTIRVSGFRLEGVTAASLNSSSLGSIDHQQIIPADDNRLFVRFDLDGVALGSYDLILEKESGETATLEDGFAVVQGTAPILLYDLSYPEEIRENRVVPVTLSFANDGNIDMPVPERTILSMEAAPISLDNELVSESTATSLQLRFHEIDGPEDILRPGALVSRTFYLYSSEDLRVRIKK